MSWQHEFTRYASDPFVAWPPGNPLQAQKLLDRLSALVPAGEPTAAGHSLLARIVEAAERRVPGQPPTLFLVNSGSSGSHWIEAMLSALPGVHACGEVYVPPAIHQRLSDADGHDRAGFLDALHLLHVEDPAARVQATDVLVNSAHSWGPHDLMGDSALGVFLLRDPLDVALSRTFRKPRLRRHLQPTASDAVYLEQNIVYVEKFFRTALRRKTAIRIRYEDALAQPAVLLGTLAQLLGLDTTSATLEQIGQRYAADQQRNTGQALSNLYRGRHPQVPGPCLDRAHERLAQLRSELGYT
jgi:hypothetical protein